MERIASRSEVELEDDADRRLRPEGLEVSAVVALEEEEEAETTRRRRNSLISPEKKKDVVAIIRR
jgi:hypothetical protein